MSLISLGNFLIILLASWKITWPIWIPSKLDDANEDDDDYDYDEGELPQCEECWSRGELRAKLFPQSGKRSFVQDEIDEDDNDDFDDFDVDGHVDFDDDYIWHYHA